MRSLHLHGLPSLETIVRLIAAFAARSRDEWTEVFDGTDCCVAPVLALREAPHHPHVRSWEVVVEVNGSSKQRLSRG
ncbi:CoA transferase [Rhodococcus wratislaviensis]|uniref:CoA transferase n=1 Tax=Rhodococcus wratislaviensis TaxID=44752 RepID=UPI001C3F3756